MAKTTVPSQYIADNAVTTAKIAANAITAAQIAGGAIVSVDLGDNSITVASIAGNAVGSSEIAANAVENSEIAANAVDSAEIVSGSIDTAHLSADAVDGTKIADDSIDSEHYVDGSIDTAHIGDSQVTNAKLANSSVTVNSNEVSLGASITLDTDDIGEGSTNQYFTNARAQSAISAGTGITVSSGEISIAGNAVTATMIAANAVGSSEIAGNSVDSAEIAANAVSTSELASTAAPTFASITTTGDGDIGGNLTVTGNLQVDGTTTTINSTNLEVDDLNITVAAGAANAAAADGAGITVDGASATITYDGTTDKWDFNKFIEIGSGYGGTPNTESQLILNDSGNNYITIGSGASSEGGILFADSGDNDVGVIAYSHSTNSLAFRTNGVSNRMIIDSSGNVGIGETSINHTLDVAGNMSTTGELYLETQNKKIAFNAGNSSSNKIGAWDYSSGSPVNPRAYIEFLGVEANQDTDIVFYTSTDATSVTEVMRVTENQRVGIGTDTPQRNLTVTGSADTPSDNTGIFSITDGTGVNTDAKIQFGITSNGHGYIHTVKPGTDIKSLLLAPAGGSGRVGIGINSTPNAKLHIQPSNSDTLETAIFTRQNNAAGTDGNTFSLRNDAANNFVEMNSGGTNNGGYKFYTGNFSGDPALTIVGSGATGGYVGIGTDTPQTLFETATTGTTTNRLTVSSANEFSQIWVEDDDLQGILWKDGSDFTFGPAADVDGSGWGAYITIEDGGNVGIGDAPSSTATGSMSPRLFVDNNLGDSTLGLQIASYHPSIVLSDKSAGLHNYKISHDGGIFAIGYEGGTAGSSNSFTGRLKISSTGNVGIGSHTPGHLLHVHGGNAHTNLAVTTNDGYKSEVRMMEDAGGTTHGGFIRYDGNGDYVQIGHYNNGTEMMGWSMDDAGNIAVGATNASGHFEVHGGRMGIVSTDSSWEQLRVCNTSSSGEAGIAIFNGANSTEFLADTQPTFSNAFTLAINPYGCGADTLAIGHGNLTDSIWHIDGSGNFGFGPNTENPVSYYEISKSRPNVNQPSDYELKLTLNTYGYVNDNYKLAMLQWLGGDSASAQDNFYAGIGSTALDGSNNSEEGSLDFHVRNGVSTTETLAVQIIGKAGTGIAGSGQHAKSVLFRYQGIAIDRVWANYPGISVLNSSDYSTTASTQAEFRFHGTNSSSAAYPGTSGSDFSVVVRSDGGYAEGSDRRRKRNITTIDNALDTVKQLTGKRFQTVNRAEEVQEHVSKNGYKFGFIAQEVEDIIPEAVQYHADEDDGTENWNTAYSMHYGSVVALLVNAIKEQDEVIQNLKGRIEALEE